eukprot:287141-Rhodomonas_salina.1
MCIRDRCRQGPLKALANRLQVFRNLDQVRLHGARVSCSTTLSVDAVLELFARLISVSRPAEIPLCALRL